MTLVIGVITAIIFFLLSALHVLLAVITLPGTLRALIPEINGRPAFVPSKAGTLLVALGLGICSALVLGQVGLLDSILPGKIYQAGTVCLAIVLALRAIGDFRLVGFFKKVRNSTFAKLDTWLYSPLCALLAVFCTVLAFGPQP